MDVARDTYVRFYFPEHFAQRRQNHNLSAFADPRHFDIEIFFLSYIVFQFRYDVEGVNWRVLALRFVGNILSAVRDNHRIDVHLVQVGTIYINL